MYWWSHARLCITTSLPKRDAILKIAILKSKNNKRRLASVLSTFSKGENVTMETRNDGVFDHDEADVTTVSYVLKAAKNGKRVISVLSVDTDRAGMDPGGRGVPGGGGGGGGGPLTQKVNLKNGAKLLCLKHMGRTISLFLHQKCFNVNSSGHKESQNCNFQPLHAC